MKDLPHHMKKLNRRIVRSAHREELLDGWESSLPTMPERQQTVIERKKIAKRERRAQREQRTPVHLTPEERNRKMKARVPVFDRNTAKPKVAKPSRKKTPRI